MRVQHRTPLSGLLVGLVALILFASAAVAMTAHGSTTAGAGALPAQTGAGDTDVDAQGFSRDRRDRPRFDDRGVGRDQADLGFR